MSDMAHQSCFITAIAFLSLIARYLDCGLLSLGLAKLKLLSVQAALQFVVLQHGVNSAALFLDLRLLALPLTRQPARQDLPGLLYPSWAAY